MNKQIRITVLGGQEEIGLNSTVIEVENDIVIIDLGNNFEDSQLGVDFYIPNIELLRGQIDKIRGILITHGHYDHRGALPFLIEKLGYPTVYGSPFTLQLIKQQLGRFKKARHYRLQTIHPRQEINLGKIQAKAVHLTHSIIGSYGYLLKTVNGNIFHSGDFKFDDYPFEEEPSDYQTLYQAGHSGILLALIDSTRANREGHSRSETSIAQNLEKLVSNAPGRVIVSTFAQMISRINQIALIGKKYQRHIFTKGSTLEKTIKIAKEMKILSRELKIREAEEMENFPDRQILLFATGSQGEEKAALNRMLEVKKGVFKIRPTDTIILSSSSIPTNVAAIQKLVDSFADRECQVFTDDIIDIHAGGHAHQDELKKLIEILKPRFILPISGYISLRHQLAQLAYSLGYRKHHLIIAKNNQPVFLNQQNFKKTGGKMKKANVVIADQVIKNGPEIINQRRKAGKKGILFVFIHPQKRTVRITSFGVPDFVTSQIRRDLSQRKIPQNDFKEIKKALEKILRVHFKEEFIPVIKIESL